MNWNWTGCDSYGHFFGFICVFVPEALLVVQTSNYKT